MSSLVLYRTYRPRLWEQVIGQDHIVKVLKESIKLGKISHAYLFSGSRGTGKTSVARILARDLGTAEEDIYEIDAASKRKIEDMRELREYVAVLPFSSKYKVYIVDEVHMLTNESWNAFLKTLEEPPAHVVFILATTELDKVPETIVSRCQTFVFHKPSRDIIRLHVLGIAKKEGYTLDAGGADLIAMFGDGSFRDALGTLEKVISASADKRITRKEVETVTGAPKAGMVNEFIEELLDKNTDKAISALNRASNSGISMKMFSALMLEKIRFILLMQHSPSSVGSIKERLSPDDFDFVSAQVIKKAVSPSMLSVLLEASDAIDRAIIDSLPLEMAVVRITEKM